MMLNWSGIELLAPPQLPHDRQGGQHQEHRHQPQRVPEVQGEHPRPTLARLLDERHDLQPDHRQHTGHEVQNEPAQKRDDQGTSKDCWAWLWTCSRFKSKPCPPAGASAAAGTSVLRRTRARALPRPPGRLRVPRVGERQRLLHVGHAAADR